MKKAGISRPFPSAPVLVASAARPHHVAAVAVAQRPAQQGGDAAGALEVRLEVVGAGGVDVVVVVVAAFFLERVHQDLQLLRGELADGLAGVLVAQNDHGAFSSGGRKLRWTGRARPPGTGCVADT